MWKCRFCDFETSNYEELIKHERSCYKKYEENTRKKREEELVIDVNKLNTYKQEYERFADKIMKRYSKDELEKFKELFPADKRKETSTSSQEKKYIPYYSLTDDDISSILGKIIGR
jgi:hypothetical protein